MWLTYYAYITSIQANIQALKVNVNVKVNLNVWSGLTFKFDTLTANGILPQLSSISKHKPKSRNMALQQRLTCIYVYTSTLGTPLNMYIMVIMSLYHKLNFQHDQ